MSFRSRLRVFFAIIVVVPMLAAGLVLFVLTADSERGKADARLAQALRTSIVVHDRSVSAARRELDAVAALPALRDALARPTGRELAAGLRSIVRSRSRLRAVALYADDGRLLARAGTADAVAFATARPRLARGGEVGTLAVSVTSAKGLLNQLARHTGLELRLSRDRDLLASTIPADGGGSLGAADPTVRERAYRGRVERLGLPPAPVTTLGVYGDADLVDSRITESRIVIAGILVAFLFLALVSSVFVVRALQAQVQHFLSAARRVGGGDFSEPIPVSGGDEFAALGEEFNRMSERLADQIGEVSRQRAQLEEAIRRVGDAFAAGLDRENVVELAVNTALDALGAQSGRAVPVDPDKMPGAVAGDQGAPFVAALQAAERRAFAVDPDFGMELMSNLDASIEAPSQRRPVQDQAGGIHALALPLRASLGPGGELRYVGVVSVAREGRAFDQGESELFGYLAGQAVVSIENVDLHETVQRQALTDELTGLFNIRQFHRRLDEEIERHRRFGGEVGLVMLDVDDFKQVNDSHGHQQGDLVLIEIARVLRDLSRDIDLPARYGGEELAMILPQTDLAGAEQAAERARQAVEQISFERLDGGPPLKVTASFGVACLPSSATTKEDLIAAADAALYVAKRAGKNRVKRAEAIAA